MRSDMRSSTFNHPPEKQSLCNMAKFRMENSLPFAVERSVRGSEDELQPTIAAKDKPTSTSETHCVGGLPAAQSFSSLLTPSKTQKQVLDPFSEFDFEYENRVSTPIGTNCNDPSSNLSQDHDSVVSKVSVQPMSTSNMPRPGTPLKLENVRYSGIPYANYWASSYRAYVNNKDVTATGAFSKGPLEEGKNTDQQQSGRTKGILAKLVSALYPNDHNSQPQEQTQERHDSGAICEGSLGLHLNKEHAHTQNIDLRATNAGIRLENSSSGLRSLSLKRPNSIQGVNPGVVHQVANLEGDCRNQVPGLTEPNHSIAGYSCLLPKDKVEDINQWVTALPSNTPHGESQEKFLSLTTAELIRYGGADIDGIEIVKKYYAPQNTPNPMGCLK
jgi:hypothetical protein